MHICEGRGYQRVTWAATTWRVVLVMCGSAVGSGGGGGLSPRATHSVQTARGGCVRWPAGVLPSLCGCKPARAEDGGRRGIQVTGLSGKFSVEWFPYQ